MADNETQLESLVEKINALARRMGWECYDIYDAIRAAKAAVKDEILNGAGEAYDTLKELQDLITNNQSGIAALEALAAGHVHYDKEQTLTEEQKLRARTNIGATSGADTQALADRVTTAESDIDALEGRATALETRMTTAESDIDALEAALGQPSDADFVALFESSLASGRPTAPATGE